MGLVGTICQKAKISCDYLNEPFSLFFVTLFFFFATNYFLPTFSVICIFFR